MEQALSRTNDAFDTFKAQHATVQRYNSDLQSALNAEKGAVVNANQTITNFQSDLQTAQVGSEIPEADYNTKVAGLEECAAASGGKGHVWGRCNSFFLP
ncbi:hypothetical protein OG21DRAFT_1515550 [Imleria badia]|nr:hypothetical protein OG21DRAFT_1515550 [Imleria badia]